MARKNTKKIDVSSMLNRVNAASEKIKEVMRYEYAGHIFDTRESAINFISATETRKILFELNQSPVARNIGRDPFNERGFNSIASILTIPEVYDCIAERFMIE